MAVFSDQSSAVLLIDNRLPTEAQSMSFRKGRISYARFASDPLPYVLLKMRYTLKIKTKLHSVSAGWYRYKVESGQLYDAEDAVSAVVGKI